MAEKKASGGRERLVGQTKDVGWEIGARRTLPVPPAKAWALLTSPEGIALWLGKADSLEFAKGEKYTADDGASGEVRVFRAGSHLRVTRQPGGWPRASTLQVRVIPSGQKTVISFHEEHLPGAAEREERRAHYAAALDALETRLASG